MLSKIKEHLIEVDKFQTSSVEELEQFRINYLGKKGLINGLFIAFKQLSNQNKKALGQPLNDLKNKAQEKINQLKALISQNEESITSDIDLTMSAEPSRLGSRHPISIVKNEIIDIFARLGFTISEGPEIEDDWHNFSALNLPEEHPARDMQDTFFIQRSPDILLRTHTSSVQVRHMAKRTPPIRTISPGRVFRNEAISARAHCIFHQIEGLYIDEKVSFSDLKQTLLHFAQEFFGTDTEIRLRPSYFPFTEPSAEVDISCKMCKGIGCNICKHSGWVEILGCGMIDPNVLKNCNIDPNKFSGFAFGMGVERIAMLKYQIKDLRFFFENDIRFLEQFKKA
tara:strand:+ start:837 stop:1856 length:1020 start_codon:yes stop_codon:yes gene_type:complete